MKQLRSYLKATTRRSVVVQLKSGTSLRGVLVDVYRDCIVLRHAGAAPSGARDFTDVDGEQAIPRDNVDWMQVLRCEEAGQ